mgnify:FL=1
MFSFFLFLSISSTIGYQFHSTAITTSLRAIDCTHFEACSGCVKNSDLLAVDRVRSSSMYFKSLDPQYTVKIPTKATSWRVGAKLAVSSASKFDGGCNFGLFRANSHEVEPITECKVHHPSINHVLSILTAATKKVKTLANKDLRYVLLNAETTTSLVSITLVWNAESYKECQPNLSRLEKEIKRLDKETKIVHSIHANYNVGKGNAISARGEEKWERLYGPPFIVESMFRSGANGDASGVPLGKLFFSPSVFRQANFEGFKVIVEEIADFVIKKKFKRICELYAGVGMIGLGVLARAGGGVVDSIRLSDENPENLICFQKSMRSLGLKEGIATYKKLSAADAISAGEADGCECLIVDPPRKGLDDDVLDYCCATDNELRNLVYVSCGFDALARDVEKLRLSDWEVSYSKGFILFPGSNHIENLVIMSR